MAEIKDVYSLEFDAASFEAQVDSAIAKIDELNASLEDGADVSEVLASAQEELNNVLQTEAKTTQQLTQKRDVLVKTEKNLNKESQTGVAVGKQLNQTNQQLATSTAQVATQQKNLGGQLLQGARNINSMKRAVGLLRGAFNLLGGLNPFGLIATVLPTVLGYFTSFFNKTQDGVDNMEKLSDSSTTYTEKLSIASEELAKLQEIENTRGSLTDEEKKKRAELVKVYQQTAEQIIKEEEERVKRQIELEDSIRTARIKLLGDTVGAVEESYKLETDKIKRAARERLTALQLEESKLFVELAKAQADYSEKSTFENNKRVLALQESLSLISETQNANTEEQKLLLELAERDKVKRINEINQRALKEREQQEKEAQQKRLDAINLEIDQQKKRQELLVLQTEDGTAERFQAELDALNVIEDLYKKYAKELGMTDTELKLLLAKNQEERNKLDEQFLKNQEAKAKAVQEVLDAERKAFDESNKAYKDSLDQAAQYRVNNQETGLNDQLLQLELERNALLKANYGNAEEQAKIQEEFNKKRLNLENTANKEIIKTRIEFLEKLRDASGDDPLALSAVNKQISELKLKFTELDKAATDSSEKTKMSAKEITKSTLDLVTQASDAVFSVLTAQSQAYIDSLDKAADRSRSTLDEIRQNSENFNARQLELEKQRLEELEQQRREAVEREKAIALVQLVVNSTLAIAKAAAESPATAPFAIASTIIALIAGFAQARAAAGSAFYEGSEYIDKENRFPAGRDTVPARLNKGERVITTDTNSKYWDVLTAVHNKKIPADVLNGFANNYMNGGLKNSLLGLGSDVNLNSELGGKSFFINMNADNNRLESRLESIENLLSDLPKYMPSTTVMANANGIFQVVETRQRKANFNRSRSK
jgi:ABC-type transporter Mla subunit MlaD